MAASGDSSAAAMPGGSCQKRGSRISGPTARRLHRLEIRLKRVERAFEGAAECVDGAASSSSRLLARYGIGEPIADARGKRAGFAHLPCAMCSVERGVDFGKVPDVRTMKN